VVVVKIAFEPLKMTHPKLLTLLLSFFALLLFFCQVFLSRVRRDPLEVREGLFYHQQVLQHVSVLTVVLVWEFLPERRIAIMLNSFLRFPRVIIHSVQYLLECIKNSFCGFNIQIFLFKKDILLMKENKLREIVTNREQVMNST
jgi:hypothetical protein